MNNKYVWGGVIVIVLIAIGFWGGFFKSDNDGTEEEYAVEEYQVENLGLSFEYKTTPDGYTVDDLTSFIGEQPEDINVHAVYRVINAREKAEIEASEGGREGPPTINVVVFSNEQNLTASQWVDAFPLYSNIDFALGTVDRDAVVGGANAVHYLTDGLYQGDTFVVAHGGRIYQFIGLYLEVQDVIHSDFLNLVDSVAFISETGVDTPQAKIDIRVACESALAYMTFTSGTEADAFVASCIDGDHPEVIERYISDMGLDGATI